MNRSDIKEMIIIIFIAVVIIQAFPPGLVHGFSMSPAYNEGDIVIMQKLFPEIKKGDVIVVNIMIEGNSKMLVKRVLGVPGDKIESTNGYLLINGHHESPDYWEEESYTLDEGQFFLVGDNEMHSCDSRFFGPVSEENIVGKVLLKTEGIKWRIPGKS